MSLSALILAAGRSTRLKGRRPKALHEVCGKPMLWYVLDACYEAGCGRVMVVVGHGKDEVIAQFADDERIVWVEQTEQLGTGHAARSAAEEIKQLAGEEGDLFILAGDGPLIRGQVLRTLHEAHVEERAAASMATAILDDPTGFGRIVRDGAGEFLDIVEQIDCTPEQREIKEVFPSYYCVRGGDLLFALSRLSNENKKREYYLTDIYGILRRAGRKALAVQAVTAEDVLSVNTRQQQAEVDAVMQDRIQRRLRDAGVTVVSGYSTYVEAGVTAGPDTIIYPFSYVGRDSVIGANCMIGPHAIVPRDSIVPDDSTVAGNVSRENSGLRSDRN